MDFHIFVGLLTFVIGTCFSQLIFPWFYPVQFAYWALGGPGIGAPIPQDNIMGANADIGLIRDNAPPKSPGPATAAPAPAAGATPAPDAASDTKPPMGIVATLPPDAKNAAVASASAAGESKTAREIKLKGQPAKMDLKEGIVMAAKHHGRNDTVPVNIKLKTILQQSLEQFVKTSDRKTTKKST
ncbi:uncharacterized protein LOC129591927 isoform X2 [Paramacrobiotus metropolitanus]|uniref:uncharacterized protein LOC129591927 isoform X2 n=1 Tax=Paramacrobiotus metropolitanus TaxID=2943436 RepID=UPI002445FDE8|nr:uncharacterized protein LOC129591927 isoform X2 [Paramacrobiotus metropolitanus]